MRKKWRAMYNMEDIISVLRSKRNVVYGHAADESQIEQAENALGLKFAPDYKDYLRNTGCISVDGSELTGISDLPNYDVVGITTDERKYAPYVPGTWYVIEQMHIDGIVIWQSSTGEIYQTSPMCETVKIHDSLGAYIKTL